MARIVVGSPHLTQTPPTLSGLETGYVRTTYAEFLTVSR
jgi:hypothetical protein